METKQTGIRFPSDEHMKAKYIAWFDRTTVTDIVVDLVAQKIKDWEKKNGKITSAQIEQAKIK